MEEAAAVALALALALLSRDGRNCCLCSDSSPRSFSLSGRTADLCSSGDGDLGGGRDTPGASRSTLIQLRRGGGGTAAAGGGGGDGVRMCVASGGVGRRGGGGGNSLRMWWCVCTCVCASGCGCGCTSSGVANAVDAATRPVAGTGIGTAIAGIRADAYGIESCRSIGLV